MAEKLRGYLPASAKIEPDPLGKRVLVTASASVRQEAATLVALLDQTEAQETWTFTLDYADPDSTLQVIQGILTPEISSAWIDRRTRTLTATDFPGNLTEVEARIRDLDVATKQVLIEARIVQVSLDEGIKTGIDWEVIEQDLNNLSVQRATFPVLSDTDPGLRVFEGDLGPDDYRVAFEALETFGSTDLLSSPRILVADGQTASILVGTQVPYITVDTRQQSDGTTTDRFEKVTIVSVGVQLDVEVVIHNDGVVEMTVVPEVSSVTGFVDTIPVVETSTTTSRILVKDRKTVILGGLNKTEVRETRNGIPFLGRIPILGRLFSSRDSQNVQTELAIFLTPRIVSGLEDVLE
jgi:general secretion pathway protein D